MGARSKLCVKISPHAYKVHIFQGEVAAALVVRVEIAAFYKKLESFNLIFFNLFWGFKIGCFHDFKV